MTVAVKTEGASLLWVYEDASQGQGRDGFSDQCPQDTIGTERGDLTSPAQRGTQTQGLLCVWGVGPGCRCVGVGV